MIKRLKKIRRSKYAKAPPVQLKRAQTANPLFAPEIFSTALDCIPYHFLEDVIEDGRFLFADFQLSPREIAENRNCIDEDNFWTPNTVTVILRDERYIGKNVYGKRMRDMVGNVHTVKVSKADWITVNNTHDGIVTQEEFDRAQANLRAYVEHDGIAPYQLLQRKVRCGVCGHVMRRGGTGKPYYLCKTPLVTDAYSCLTDKTREHEIMDALLDGLRVQAQTAVEMSLVWEEQRKKHRKDAKSKPKYKSP